MKDLNELRDKAYQCAVEHGWHEEKLSNEHFLCLVISELMEAVEADRKDNHANKEYYENRISPQIRNPTKVSERCGPNRQECDFSSLD